MKIWMRIEVSITTKDMAVALQNLLGGIGDIFGMDHFPLEDGKRKSQWRFEYSNEDAGHCDGSISVWGERDKETK